jgi:hypothetical protein
MQIVHAYTTVTHSRHPGLPTSAVPAGRRGGLAQDRAVGQKRVANLGFRAPAYGHCSRL